MLHFIVLCLLFKLFHVAENLTVEDLKQLKIVSSKNLTIDDLPVMSIKSEEISFYLWTRKAKDLNLIIDNETNFKFINKRKPYKIIIHGYKSSSNQSWIHNMATSFLEKENLNVILVDWSSIAKFEYPNAVSYIPSIGKYIAKIIIEIENNFEYSLSNMHILGHSLGAHLAGIVGMQIKKELGREVNRITAMDPASIYFVFASKKNKLDISDANFVDVIHTDVGQFGLSGAQGTVDFYPQGGFCPQPACEINKTSEIFVGCSHSISHDYYIESITSTKFIAKCCESFNLYLQGFCDKRNTAVMGEHINTNSRGKYYLTVNKAPKYARNGKI